jgi:hypothetical protein
MDNTKEDLLWIAVAAFLVPFSIAANAVLVEWCWRWFLVPLGVPPIGLAHAAGIGILATLLTGSLGPQDKRSLKDQVTNAIFVAAMRWVIFAVTALVIHEIMVS